MSRLRGCLIASALLTAVGCAPSDGTGENQPAENASADAVFEGSPFIDRNARLLGLAKLTFEPKDADQTRVTWRIPGFDPGISQVDVSGEGVTPLWLTEAIQVRRAPGVLVFGAVGTSLDRLLKDARAARSHVLAFFPQWDGKLVVEVPSTPVGLADSLNGQPEDYAGVAAITSASDGSRRFDTPIHVFVNADVYAAMAPTAARIVMTHEVVHVVTRAPTVRVPLWWAEGLADYVAFSEVDRRDVGAARGLLGSGEQQLAAHVHEHGVPDGLPAEEDFAGDAQDAAYASARLACELLAERSRDRSAALGRVQRLLTQGVSEQRAVRQVFGISHQEFVGEWQTRLGGMAESFG